MGIKVSLKTKKKTRIGDDYPLKKEILFKDIKATMVELYKTSITLYVEIEININEQEY